MYGKFDCLAAQKEMTKMVGTAAHVNAQEFPGRLKALVWTPMTDFGAFFGRARGS